MKRSREPSSVFVVTAVVAIGCADAPTPQGIVVPAVLASCTYTNPFSMRGECKDYVGASWTMTTATTDCERTNGTLQPAVACEVPAALGRCMIRGAMPDATRITFPGSDASQCAITQTGCTVFARGEFVPAGVCAAGGNGGVTGDAGATDAATTTDASTSAAGVFLPPTQTCRAPRAGEPAGNSPGGQVCTWNAISASTEEGRRYDDYASCEHVRTQRPYYPVPPATPPATPDTRMQDATYVAELNWVRGQVESSACVCCHSQRTAPSGPSNWYVEAPGNWMNSFDASGLALGAGWIDSTSFGAYPAAQNNGFSRTLSGFPSTDPARMRNFFERELMHRGFTRADFESTEPFGGPIYRQSVYQPTACAEGRGVDADGTVRWGGGPARYVYVLDAGSANPGVPPNLDLPRGTRWRVDVAPTSSPVASGIMYGRVPNGATQRFPETGAPAPLQPGAMYYLYVLLDVGVPITRCLFTMPR